MSECHESANQPLPWWDLCGRGLSLIRFGLAHCCSRALPLSCLHTLLRIVTVRRTFLSPLLSRASEWPLSCYRVIFVIFVIRHLLVPLTWYLVSHDRLDLCMDLSPCLLMFQGVLSHSIPHSYCTRIKVLTLVDDY